MVIIPCSLFRSFLILSGDKWGLNGLINGLMGVNRDLGRGGRLGNGEEGCCFTHLVLAGCMDMRAST